MAQFASEIMTEIDTIATLVNAKAFCGLDAAAATAKYHMEQLILYLGTSNPILTDVFNEISLRSFQVATLLSMPNDKAANIAKFCAVFGAPT